MSVSIEMFTVTLIESCVKWYEQKSRHNMKTISGVVCDLLASLSSKNSSSCNGVRAINRLIIICLHYF